ncbi:PREDICTED: schlafen family member 13-like [Nanorana parkeri]|uniref:schlafen family member 13-like n=1 Tax=Nanorana parkeri TaxID=125878 RepID=UPI0008541D14|nr:PREDICTED: schlafen family member 13-like [Nanorana parkeri]
MNYKISVDTSYPDQVLYAGEATLGKNQRKSIAKQKRIIQRKNISKAVCTLLNSGGGIVRVGFADKDYNYIQDGLPEDIKTILSELISSLLLQDYLDLIQCQSFLLIFVKTWSTQNGFPKLCSLDTGLYVRSGTSTIKSDGMQLLNRARGNVKKACRSSGASWQPNQIKHWLDKPHLCLGENLGLTESEHVEFKDFSKGKLEVRMKEIIKLYFSAFGNSDGGYMIIGIDDNGIITGCGKDLTKPELEECIKRAIDKLKIVHFCDSSDQDSSDRDSNDRFYTLTIKDVKDTDQGDSGYVIFLEVKPVCCLAFAHDPQSWILDADQKEKRLSASKWAKIMTNEPSESLKSQFYRLCIGERPPLAKTVCIKKGLENLQELQDNILGKFYLYSHIHVIDIVEMWKMGLPFTIIKSLWLLYHQYPPPATWKFEGTEDHFGTGCAMRAADRSSIFERKVWSCLENRITIKPDHLYSELKEEYPGLEGLLQTVVANEEGVIILSRSWAVDLEEKSNRNVVCDALLLFSGKHPNLCSVVKGKVSQTEYEYTLGTARALKKKLVNLGGYTRKLCVIPAVLQLNSENHAPPFSDITYPETYKLGDSKAVKELLPYLLIVMLSFRSYFDDNIGIEHFNLLTTEQYKLLSKKCVKGPFFVHGPPGTGKTVVALEIIKKMKNTFNCSPENILFICENLPLRQYVRSKKICHTVTRRSFEIKGFPNVKHIVADEAQNFQVENDNWFEKAKRIIEDAGGRGVFYVFLDYFQLCHTKDTGLPQQERCNIETLTKIIRIPEEIYNYIFESMRKIASEQAFPLMNEIIEETECCHGVSGHYELCDGINEAEIVKRVADTCKEYLSTGYTQGDIAILCSTTNAAKKYRPLFEEEMKEATKKLRARVNPLVKAEDIMKNAIVLDSVRRFSGLERPIVFAINPVCADNRVDDNLSLCAASRATASFHLYYEP